MGSNAPKSLLDETYREMAARFLESVMERRELNKAGLAKALGVDRSVASRYLSRDVRPPLQRLQHITRSLEIEVPKALSEAFWASEGNTSQGMSDISVSAALMKRLIDTLADATIDERRKAKRELEDLLSKLS